jgi:hypothetical protein
MPRNARSPQIPFSPNLSEARALTSDGLRRVGGATARNRWPAADRPAPDGEQRTKARGKSEGEHVKASCGRADGKVVFGAPAGPPETSHRKPRHAWGSSGSDGDHGSVARACGRGPWHRGEHGWCRHEGRQRSATITLSFRPSPGAVRAPPSVSSGRMGHVGPEPSGRLPEGGWVSGSGP